MFRREKGAKLGENVCFLTCLSEYKKCSLFQDGGVCLKVKKQIDLIEDGSASDDGVSSLRFSPDGVRDDRRRC